MIWDMLLPEALLPLRLWEPNRSKVLGIFWGLSDVSLVCS
jgi:hypothetical protein